MHRQLRAERNFSSYPWVDVFDSPAAAAGGVQADTAPNDNARPRHSAPNRLVLFIRSPPPNGPPLRCDAPPAYRPGRRSARPKREYGSRQWQDCVSLGGNGRVVTGFGAIQSARQRAKRSPAMASRILGSHHGRSVTRLSRPRCLLLKPTLSHSVQQPADMHPRLARFDAVLFSLNALMPRSLDALMPSSREMEPGGIEPPCRNSQQAASTRVVAALSRPIRRPATAS